MFNVKFFGDVEGGSVQKSISCAMYNVYDCRDDGVITIVTYPGMTDDGSVEHHLGNREGDFAACYVENVAGKTVDAFRVK